jgi:hypothetical protein
MHARCGYAFAIGSQPNSLTLRTITVLVVNVKRAQLIMTLLPLCVLLLCVLLLCVLLLCVLLLCVLLWLQISRHEEFWNVSPVAAILMLLKPGPPVPNQP